MAGGAMIRCDALEQKIRAKLPSLIIKVISMIMICWVFYWLILGKSISQLGFPLFFRECVYLCYASVSQFM